MDEIIVSVCRTVACETRLKILAVLAREVEITPTALAERLRMTLTKISSHLRRLTAAGLIQRRRSGGWCHCVAQSPYAPTTFSGSVSRWLFALLRDPTRSLKNCGVAQL